MAATALTAFLSSHNNAPPLASYTRLYYLAAAPLTALSASSPKETKGKYILDKAADTSLAVERQAGPLDEKEIEVTPEMISAGLRALEDQGSFAESELVAYVYRAMYQVRPVPVIPDHHSSVQSQKDVC